MSAENKIDVVRKLQTRAILQLKGTKVQTIHELGISELSVYRYITNKLKHKNDRCECTFCYSKTPFNVYAIYYHDIFVMYFHL